MAALYIGKMKTNVPLPCSAVKRHIPEEKTRRCGLEYDGRRVLCRFFCILDSFPCYQVSVRR